MTDADLIRNLREALLVTAPHRPTGGELFCWCAMPWTLRPQHEHSPTCQKVRGIVYRTEVLTYHAKLDTEVNAADTSEPKS